jgi:hypothetical protein
VSNYSEQVLATPDLKAYWQMAEAAGDLADSSGRGHTAVSGGGALTYGQAGARASLGNSIAFIGGAGSTFAAPDHADWDAMRNAGTIECWLKQNAAGYGEAVGRMTGGGVNYEWMLWVDTGANSAKYFERSQMPSGWAQAGWPSAGDALWHHYAMVWDGVSLRKYQDAVLAATTAKPGAGYRDLAGKAWIGGPDVGFNFIGNQQHVALYGRALTLLEITAHYNETPLSKGFHGGLGGSW